MVGFAEPCPCCGNKKGRTSSPLERASSCPTPQIVRSYQPSPLVRSISAPIPGIFDHGCSHVTPAETTLNPSPPPAPSSAPSGRSIPNHEIPLENISKDSSRSIPCPISPSSADPISTTAALPSQSDPVDAVRYLNVVKTNGSDLIKKQEVKDGGKEDKKKKKKKKRKMEEEEEEEGEEEKGSKEKKVAGGRELKFSVTCVCGAVHEFVITGERFHTVSRRFSCSREKM